MSSNVEDTCEASLKKRRANNIKKLMKEYKLVFGELIETKVQKKKKLKLQSLSAICQEKPNKNDTELFWVMQNSTKNLKRITVLQNQPIDDSRDSQIAKTEKNILLPKKTEIAQDMSNEISNPTCNLATKMTKDINNNYNKTVFTRETSSFNQNVLKEDSNIHNNASLANSNKSDIENATAKSDVFSKFERLPDIIIKNIPSFPIMSNKQESFTNNESTEVLSVSGSDDPKTIKFPSVTKILTQTMSLESKLALEAWKERMIEKLGPDGFEVHKKGMNPALITVENTVEKL